jgi:hypothetical protein
MKSIGRAQRTETGIATSTLLRIAFEYGQLVDASHGDGKRGGQLKASCFISTKVDAGDDVDIVIYSPRFAARLFDLAFIILILPHLQYLRPRCLTSGHSGNKHRYRSQKR